MVKDFGWGSKQPARIPDAKSSLTGMLRKLHKLSRRIEGRRTTMGSDLPCGQQRFPRTLLRTPLRLRCDGRRHGNAQLRRPER